ncbi:MAG TPA: 30S ribosomal protein S24e [Methanomassiliicoccales archaeon]|nr:30S ribosomal protein S24e [Methanomassiliicoccales archaeon]
MKIEIENKKPNALMDRTEVNFKADHSGEGSPKRADVKAKLAEVLAVSKDKVVIDHMETEFGMGVSTGYAKVYGSADSAKKFEKNYIQARNGLAEPKKAGKKK